MPGQVVLVVLALPFFHFPRLGLAAVLRNSRLAQNVVAQNLRRYRILWSCLRLAGRLTLLQGCDVNPLVVHQHHDVAAGDRRDREQGGIGRRQVSGFDPSGLRFIESPQLLAGTESVCDVDRWPLQRTAWPALSGLTRRLPIVPMRENH